MRGKGTNRDEAIIVMVESNLQRSAILPSEKAYAYKMRLEAMKRQAGRPPKENSSQWGHIYGVMLSLLKKLERSRNQIQRYIRLTELVPEILQMVDERQIAFRPAVEISYLSDMNSSIPFWKPCSITMRLRHLHRLSK